MFFLSELVVRKQTPDYSVSSLVQCEIRFRIGEYLVIGRI